MTPSCSKSHWHHRSSHYINTESLWENAFLTRVRLLFCLIFATNVFVSCVSAMPECVFSSSDMFHLSSSSQSVIAASLGPSESNVAFKWRVSVSDTWDVLGPFPIHAREQHFLSPSYPLSLSEQIDYSARWPSSYADNGEVSWTKAISINGNLAVTFPKIRWESLRAYEGWAALQHHTVLRASITVYPPSAQDGGSQESPRLLVDVKQGSFFTILPSWQSDPSARASATPRWHAGNIYSMNAAPAQALHLPSLPLISEPTSYDLFISGDYEIRLFGDPIARNTQIPELLVDCFVSIENTEEKLELEPSHHVVPDFVNGWAFGQAMGIGLRSVDGWWTVTEVKFAGRYPEAIQVELLQVTRIAPTQTRIVPVILRQKDVFLGSDIALELLAVSPSSVHTILPFKISLKQLDMWDGVNYSPVIASYFYGTSTPTAFVAIPPKQSSGNTPQPPLLSLHGAGVNVIGHSSWDCAPPQQNSSWIIAPTGRTAWGLDWHGPSTQDAWQTVEALSNILDHRSLWHSWRFPPDTRVVVIGHSNGGQGTWHITSRYPDRVISAVPAAAYMKSQAYVPLVQSRSAHFIDPALRAILESSLTPDDNDLFLSNLVDTPVLAVHGGADENVPVWHSRALVDVLKTWKRDADVTFQEDPEQPHCYPTVFNNEHVQTFIDRTVVEAQTVAKAESRKPWRFTLTVAVPSESGSFHGWQIHSLEVPGRLARLDVQERDGIIFVNSRNVHTFSISSFLGSPFSEGEEKSLSIDGQRLSITASQSRMLRPQAFLVRTEGNWELHEEPRLQSEWLQPSGRMSLILASRAPILFIVPEKTNQMFLDAALRLSHNLNVYHKLDAVIVDAAEATNLLHQGLLPSDQNIIVLGNSDNSLTRDYLTRSKTPFQLQNETLYLRNRPLSKDSSALFLHPHPTSASALILFLFANDASGLERALRLFPIRTGVTVPDWMVLNPETDLTGAGGVTAAGVWGVNWSWNEGMSSF